MDQTNRIIRASVNAFLAIETVLKALKVEIEESIAERSNNYTADQLNTIVDEINTRFHLHSEFELPLELHLNEDTGSVDLIYGAHIIQITIK